jgi:hypothetical protein
MLDGANLAVAVVGVIAAVASAYFAYVPVRDMVRRRQVRAPRQRPPEGQPQRPYDVFVSYADAEAGAAESLAGRLRDAGLSAFLVRWVEPGLIPLLEAERALSDATLGVLLFGVGSMADARIRDEYAALLQRTYDGGLRFVPACVGGAGLPPFAAIRQSVDLGGGPGSEGYEGEVDRLARIALRERREAGA